jgi:hypothetical protein
MFRESESMKKLHKVRERMYEETKGMSTKEFIAYIHKASEEAKKKYGLKLKSASHVS